MPSLYLRRSLLALGAVLLATGGCGPETSEPPILDDGVDVRIVVQGQGRVGWGPEFACFDDCVWSLPADEPVTLTASGAEAYFFAGWSGACDPFPQACERVFEDGAVATVKFARHVLRFRPTGDGEGGFRINVDGVDTLCDAPCGIGLDRPLQVAITYDPQGTTGTVLGNWGGACTDASLPDYCLVRVTNGTDVSKRWTHPPVAFDDAYEMVWDTALDVPEPGVLANDTDTPGDVLTAELAPGQGVAHGSLTLRPDGGFTYTPDLGYSGTDAFGYRARDDFGNRSDVATVTIEAERLNLAPVAIDGAYQVDAGSTLTVAAPGVLDDDADPEDDALTAVLESAAVNGEFELEPDGGFHYTPDDGFVGDDLFRYRAFDGELSSEPATVTIRVVALEEEPEP